MPIETNKNLAAASVAVVSDCWFAVAWQFVAVFRVAPSPLTLAVAIVENKFINNICIHIQIQKKIGTVIRIWKVKLLRLSLKLSFVVI